MKANRNISVTGAILFLSSLACLIFPGCLNDFSYFDCRFGATEDGELLRVQAGHVYGCKITVHPEDTFTFRENVYVKEDAPGDCRAVKDGDDWTYTLAKQDCLCDTKNHVCDKGATDAQQMCSMGSDSDGVVYIFRDSGLSGCAIRQILSPSANGDTRWAFLNQNTKPGVLCGDECEDDSQCNAYVRSDDCSCDCPTGTSCDCEISVYVEGKGLNAPQSNRNPSRSSEYLNMRREFYAKQMIQE